MQDAEAEQITLPEHDVTSIISRNALWKNKELIFCMSYFTPQRRMLTVCRPTKQNRYRKGWRNSFGRCRKDKENILLQGNTEPLPALYRPQASIIALKQTMLTFSFPLPIDGGGLGKR